MSLLLWYIYYDHNWLLAGLSWLCKVSYKVPQRSSVFEHEKENLECIMT